MPTAENSFLHYLDLWLLDLPPFMTLYSDDGTNVIEYDLL
jgi:hypothetical protein